MARLDDRMAALVSMCPAQLRAEWEQSWGGSPPLLPPALLRLGLAYRLQEQKLGKLPASTRRQLQQIASGRPPPSPPTSLSPGTQMVREWQGRIITVTVEMDGFSLDGEQFGSLSSIAEHVTGTRWSGPRFFGLKTHA